MVLVTHLVDLSGCLEYLWGDTEYRMFNFDIFFSVFFKCIILHDYHHRSMQFCFFLT